MPEYPAPGVSVQETALARKPIEGVATSTAGFLGAARSGPTSCAIGPVTSLAEYERQFGDDVALVHDGVPCPNFLWHAVRAFFLEGGTRLWVVRVFRNGSSQDGARPGVADFESGLAALEGVDEIGVIAAPGATFAATGPFEPEALGISRALVAHAERQRDRMALLDPPNGLTVPDVRAWRAHFDSSDAALYYPWVRVAEPGGLGDLLVPPSGLVAGVVARSDIQRGVHKAPANQNLRTAVGLEVPLTKREQDVLNPEGINCLRHLEGRGFLVWGARTLGSNPEWRYVNVRRYLAYLEKSIARGLQWVVFETNDEPVWARVRSAVADFLYGEWRTGALLGVTPDEAFFVRCDRATMTQADIDAGRLVVLVGTAPIKPAEFLIFRVTMTTAPAPA